MTKTSVKKYRKLFPFCLNLNYNKCLFIFASRLGHKTVRDNEVPYRDQRGKSYFFYISGFKWRVEDINSNKLFEFSGKFSAIGCTILSNHSTRTNWLIWWGVFILAFLWHTIWKKEMGSKTDLEPCIFSTNERPFFRYLKLGKLPSNSIKSYINETVTDWLRNESALTVRGFIGCNLRSCRREGGEGDSGWCSIDFL